MTVFVGPPGFDDRVTMNVDLDLEQLRVVSKSLSRTRDAELRKLSRLKAGTHVHDEVKSDYGTLDSVIQEVDHAIECLVAG